MSLPPQPSTSVPSQTHQVAQAAFPPGNRSLQLRDTPAPLILTLSLDPESQQLFNGQRRRHFPPERNYLAARLTLFHAQPGFEQAAIEAGLAAMAAAQPPLHVSAVTWAGACCTASTARRCWPCPAACSSSPG